MDIKVEIKEELDKPSVMIKTEDISNLNVTPVIELRSKEKQSSYLPLTCVKKDLDDDYNIYESDIINMDLKEISKYSEEDDKTFSHIKIEELFLKSMHESEDDDSETRASWDDVRKKHTSASAQEIHLVQHDESAIEENNDKLICSECDHNSHDKTSLNNPILAHHNKFSCYICDFVAPQEVQLKKHLMIQHLSDIKKYSCDNCDYRSRFMGKLKRHIIFKHDKDAIKKYSCSHCDYRSHYQNNLNRHILTKHDQVTIKKYTCEYCDYMSHQKGHLKRHLITQHVKMTEQKFYCSHCDYMAHYKTALDRHVLEKHQMGIKKYGCDYCDLRTHYKGNLKKHMIINHL